MNWQSIKAWLQKTHERSPEELQGRAQGLVARFGSSDIVKCMAADRALRDIAYFWEINYDAALALAVLNALTESGSGRALPYVEHMTQAKAHNAAQKQVQAAAQACLPVMIERARQEQERDSLLRSSAGKTANGELLRPAHDTGTESAPDQLLRPNARPHANE